MFDLANTPPGIAEYAEGLRNLTNAQLFERIEAWPERSNLQPPSAEILDSMLWTLRCEIEELRRRLEVWLAESALPLPPFSAEPSCAKCGADGKADVKTVHHGEPEPEALCWLRLEAGREHLHRKCKKCGYEWLEEVCK